LAWYEVIMLASIIGETKIDKSTDTLCWAHIYWWQIIDMISEWIHVFIPDHGACKHINVCVISFNIRFSVKKKKNTNDNLSILTFVSVVLCQVSNFLAMTWQEQVTLQWDDDND
jgi:hypothetical protein